MAAASAAGSPGGHQQAARAVAEQIRRAADARGHHGAAGGQRLDERHRRAFVARRVHHHVEVAVHLGHVVAASRGSARRPPSPRRRASRFEGRALLAVAHDREARVGDARRTIRAAAARNVGTSLIGDEPAHDADERRVVVDARLAAQAAAGQRAGGERLELEAEGDDADAVGAGDAQARPGRP